MRNLLRLFVLLLASTSTLVAQIPSSRHIYIVAEENRSYETLVGSPQMPYLNSLLPKGALATQFYANQHSSLPNYFWLTAGQPITQNNETTLTYDVDNIVRRIIQRGLTYKSYAEGLPYPGYAGLYYGAYLKRHAPLPYYVDMGNSKTEMLKHVSTTEFDKDVANGTLPNFAFITPDATNDMHDCPQGLDPCLNRADNWWKTHIGPLLARPEFKPGGDGLLILWADEADLGTDNRCSATDATGCGGRIVVFMIGPKVKQGYRSTTTYHHEDLLRTILSAMGETSRFPGAAQHAKMMSDMFGSPITINVQSPANHTTIAGPMHLSASASGPKPIVALQVYVDNKLMTSVRSNSLSADLPLSPGTHLVVVQAWDSSGRYAKKSLNVTASAAITVMSPQVGATVGSPVRMQAKISSSVPVVGAKLYVDDVAVHSTTSTTIDKFVTVKPGTHLLVVQCWDANGHVTKKPVTFYAK
jgi:Phosphoesterase family/Bacterial Ig domain